MAKIMLVEDDNNLREIYEARLMAEGYDIVTARDGEEALAVAVREKPDLIISDVMMPKISGFDMLDILRSTPETKNAKVIMMTALSQAEDKARAEKLGADRYLVKSQVTLEDVAKVAREVLAGTPEGVTPPAIDAGPSEDSAAESSAPAAAPAIVTETPVAATPAQPAPTPAAATTPPAPAATPAQAAEPAAAPDPPVAAAPAPTPTAPPADDATASLVSASNVQTPPASAGITDLEPSAAPAPAAEPAAPVATETPTAPVTEPESPAPSEAPAADVPASAVPAPADEDIEKTSAELWSAPAEALAAPATDTTKTPDTEAAEAKVDAAPSKNLADEEAEIAKQIESFMGNVPTAPSGDGAEPAPAATPAPAAEPAAPAPAATETPTAEKPKSVGERVIQPLNDPTKPTGPSLEELAAKEEAKEKQTGDVVHPSEPPAGGIDPNSLAL